MTGPGTCLVVVVIRNLVEIRESPALLAGAMLASHARNVSAGQHAEGTTATKVLDGGANFLFTDCVERFLIEEGFAEEDVIGRYRVVDVWVFGGDNTGFTFTVCFLVRVRAKDKAEVVNNILSGVVSEIGIVKRIGAFLPDV